MEAVYADPPEAYANRASKNGECPVIPVATFFLFYNNVPENPVF